MFPDHIGRNGIWNRFKYFELVEIMRQKDDAPFAVALTKMAFGDMQPENIILVKSREISV